jgi:hypothetical protein
VLGRGYARSCIRTSENSLYVHYESGHLQDFEAIGSLLAELVACPQNKMCGESQP